MKKRRILINKKFQLNLAMTFAGISALTMAIIIVICTNILINNNSRLKNINASQQQLSEVQSELLKALEELGRTKDFNKYKTSTAELQKDYNNTKELYSINNEKINEIINRNNGLITILMVSYIIQTLLIFYLMLRRSQRISGPIHLMSKYFDEIIKGHYPKIRPIRKNDDFQGLFNKFKEMTDVLRKKNRD